MKFSDYMSLKEDSFGGTTPTTPQGFGDEAIEHKGFKKDGEQQDAVDPNAAIKEACEYILYVAESCDFGCDKIDRPDGHGLSTAVAALNQFASAGDGENFSRPDINDSIGDYDFDDDDDFDDIDESTHNNNVDINSVVEAAAYILNAINEAEEDDDCDDDYRTIKNGIDRNTIIPHNMEDDQFTQTIDVDNDAFNNSFDWDD